MRLSFRKIVKCGIILLIVTLFGLFIRSDSSLFTLRFSSFRHVSDIHVTSNSSGNASSSHRLLIRTQRSAKSVETVNNSINNFSRDGIVHDRLKKLPATTLKDVFISIKTTAKNHRTRMSVLLDTWASTARNQTYIFTDEDDDMLIKSFPAGHVINTKCSSDHGRKALNCKMAQEFDLFITVGKRWFCHVDDDTYVNTERLVSMLGNYNHTKDWYLGKPSLGHPIEVMDRSRPGELPDLGLLCLQRREKTFLSGLTLAKQILWANSADPDQAAPAGAARSWSTLFAKGVNTGLYEQMLAFWFATGGAGFCISRALALKMIPHAGGGRLMRAGEDIRLPDDCTIGYIINSLLRKELTVIGEFHSHLEPLAHIRTPLIAKQITFGYLLKDGRHNVVSLPGFSEEKDPTRFWSIHCHLHPLTKACLDHR